MPYILLVVMAIIFNVTNKTALLNNEDRNFEKAEYAVISKGYGVFTVALLSGLILTS